MEKELVPPIFEEPEEEEPDVDGFQNPIQIDDLGFGDPILQKLQNDIDDFETDRAMNANGAGLLRTRVDYEGNDIKNPEELE